MHSPRFTAILTIAAGLAAPAHAAIHYVDDTAPPAGNGTSWALAYRDLQLALAAAMPGDEIRIAQGLYRPAPPAGPRTTSFVMKPSVTIKGGYAGFGAPTPDARDTNLYLTTLSGDLAGDDATSNAENSYHVVRVNTGTTGAVLDGVTIRAGNANGPSYPDQSGGGILIDGFVDPCYLVACRIIANRADAFGGGAFIDEESTADFTSCSFIANEAWRESPTPTGQGGGAYKAGSGTAFNCVYSGNRALLAGGGAYSIASVIEPCYLNCTFVSNYARFRAGGLALDANAPTDAVDLANCILYANTTGTGLGPQYFDFAGDHTARYCNIEGGWVGLGTANIDVEPRLTDLPPILRRTIATGDVRPLPTSPMIDAGDSLAVSGNGDTGTVAPSPSGGPRFRNDPNMPNVGVPASDPFFPGVVVDIGAEELAENYTRWFNPGGGSWSTPANWLNDPPFALVSAAFDTPGAFTVSLSAPSSAQRLAILDGEITLDMNGFELSAFSPAWPSRVGLGEQSDPCYFPIDGKLIVDRLLVTPAACLGGGNASGAKIIEGTVINAGSFSPGGAAGLPYAEYSIQGDLFNRDGLRAGLITLDVAGATLGAQRDFISATGEADLGGGLRVNLDAGYAPGLGVMIPLLQAAGSVSGAFHSVLLPSAGAGQVLTYDNPESTAPITLTVNTRATDVDAGDASIVGIPGVATAAATGDLNGDGRPDLAVTYLLAGGAGRLRIYFNAGTDANGWLGFPTNVTFSVGTNPSDVGLADLDGNGQLDVIVANRDSNSLTMFESTGGGTFNGSTISSLPVASPRTIALGDFNGDGKDDIAVGGVSVAGFDGPADPGGAGLIHVLISTSTLARGGERALIFNSGGDIRTLKPVVASASSDIDNDKWDDVIIPEEADTATPEGATAAYRSDGDAMPFDSRAVLESLGGAGESLVCVDLNRDASPDLATVNAADGTVSIARGSGGAGFSYAVAYVIGANPSSIVSGDFSGDGVAGSDDLAVLVDGDTPGSRAIRILRNDTPAIGGEIVLTLMPLIPATAGDETVLAAADLDEDGAADPIAISGESGALAARGVAVPKVYPFTRPRCSGDANRDGAITFADVTSVLANFSASGFRFAPGDADGDGDVDFADITSVLANFGVPCP